MDKNGFLAGLSESDRTQFGKTDFEEQSVPQKVFSSIWAVESEVNNGGFQQYFQNFSAETAHFMVVAFKTIGAPKTADICDRAIHCAFPGGLPATPEEISAAAADFPDGVLRDLGLLDREFFAYPHNLTGLLFDYVSAHPADFGPVPDLD